MGESVFTNGFPVELLKGHDNSPTGFAKLAYIRLPMWLARKIQGRWNKEEQEHSLFQVVEETDKAYKILYCKDASLSYEFVRITWYLKWVPKSVVELLRTDVEQVEKEMEEYWTKKYAKEK